MEGWNLTGARAGSSAAGQRPSARRSGGVQGGFPWEGPDTPAAASRDDDALSVSQAVELAAGALDALPTLTVIGEVTGFRGPNARSGHCYFQIKDDGAAVDCIIWRGVYGKRTFDLRDGMQVQFTGNFNLYKPTGRMSFVAKTFSLAGEGLLRQQVAALAEKLRREGLMDEARKRPIPAFCTRVAVVTSLSGAVIDDVKRTLRRRNSLVELVCVGAKVQGGGAPAELISGLGRAAAMRPAPDCILLVRGGGSYEDLMTFNDEALARAVASCPVPVVTGIGHEPDTSICDMVSDRRCSTPTAAAESVAPAMSDLADLLSSRGHRLALAASSRVEGARVQIEGLDGHIERHGLSAQGARRRARRGSIAPLPQEPSSYRGAPARRARADRRSPIGEHIGLRGARPCTCTRIGTPGQSRPRPGAGTVGRACVQRGFARGAFTPQGPCARVRHRLRGIWCSHPRLLVCSGCARSRAHG